MNRLVIAAIALMAPVGMYADSFTFDTSSLDSLTHGTAYTWGLGSTVKGSSGKNVSALETDLFKGQVITSATLTISNIYDWTVEPADVLYVNLLNGVTSGISSYEYTANPNTDDKTFGPDYFDTTSKHLKYQKAQTGSLLTYNGKYETKNPGTWSDPKGGNPTGFNLVVTLTGANLSLLTQFLKSDRNTSTDLGLGFGPDCHFYDSGVTFTVDTGKAVNPVPESAMTLAMLGMALVGLAGFGRLLRKSVRA